MDPRIEERLKKEGFKKLNEAIKENKIAPVTMPDGKEGFRTDDLAQLIGSEAAAKSYGFVSVEKATQYVKENVLKPVNANGDEFITREEFKDYKKQNLPPKPKNPEEVGRG